MQNYSVSSAKPKLLARCTVKAKLLWKHSETKNYSGHPAKRRNQNYSESTLKPKRLGKHSKTKTTLEVQ